MLKKVVITVLALFILAVSGFVSAAADSDFYCTKPDEKANGDMVKFSLDAKSTALYFFMILDVEFVTVTGSSAPWK